MEYIYPLETVSSTEDYEELIRDEKCPDCGSNKTIKYMTQNGPEDYDWVLECKSCGNTLTS